MSSPASERKKASAPPVQAPGLAGARRGRVLIVDDEGPVARSTARAVKRDHEPVVETDPLLARDRLLNPEETFDVVLCDLSMPGMSGEELYRTIAAARPDVAERFVFVTGGTFTPEARAFLASIPNQCLVKPFSIEGLREIVNLHLR